MANPSDEPSESKISTGMMMKIILALVGAGTVGTTGYGWRRADNSEVQLAVHDEKFKEQQRVNREIKSKLDEIGKDIKQLLKN